MTELIIIKNAKSYVESMKNNLKMAKICKKTTQSFFKGD